MVSRKKKPRIPRRSKQKSAFPLPFHITSYVSAPVEVKHFMFGFDRSNLMFLENLKLALSRFEEITISFRHTRELEATALLVIYSIVDTLGKDKKINVVLSEISESVNSGIETSGSFKSPEHRLGLLDDRMLPVIQGNNAIVNKLSRQIINTLVHLYLDEEKSDFSNRKAEIGIAIMETLDNVGRHAYPEKEQHNEKLWWFCCDIIDDTLFMAIYDQGVGIPHSIKNSQIEFTRLIDNYFAVTGKDINKLPAEAEALTEDYKKTFSDEILIAAAMSEELSKTTKEKHGKGSGSIKALIKEDERSFLVICSQKGMYYYSKSNDENQDDETVKPLEHSIQGTLIQWSL
ncbi:hypothetical protein ACQ676_004298 [Vibrio fluvialis]